MHSSVERLCVREMAEMGGGKPEGQVHEGETVGWMEGR